ncbi:transposase [Kitasatospora sp. NPDC058032]|uniref:transposase n=1 Tax=unclassified Kitasatospora TaxID=2633591 RepID=UPI0033B20FAD
MKISWRVDKSSERGWIMARPPVIPVEQKVAIVLRVLSGAESMAQAARRAKVSEQSIANWRRQFIDGGRTGLEGYSSRSVQRERQLRQEIMELKAALGEAYFELRIRRGVARRRPGTLIQNG